MFTRTHLQRFVFLGVSIFLGFVWAPAALAQPDAPSAVVAFPSYGPAAEIVVRWQDNAVDETTFQVERRLGATWTAVATVAAHAGTGTVEWRDNTIALDTLYSYRVRARNASGDSVWVQTPADSQRPTNNFWPRTDGVHDIMNIWSGTAVGNGQKFHEGIDFHAIEPVPTPPPDVQAMRGGTLATTTFSGPGQTIAVEVTTGPGTTEYDYYLHLQDTTTKAAGDQIAPGEYLGRISTAAYGAGWRHTHVMRMAANGLGGAGWPNCRSPWRNFTTAADLDPLGNNPHLLDQSGGAGGAPDGRLIFAISATAAGTVVDPVRDDVDLLVEAYDDMNTSLAYENNLSAFAYWVEAHPPGGTAIGSAAAPLKLYDFDDTWFADFIPIRDKFDDVFDETRIHPGSALFPGFYMKRGHMIATSATAAAGNPGDADGSRFWRSKARTGSGATPYYHDALLARHNGEARFPDGRYTVHALMSDQVHLNVADTRDLIVDNWLPYVLSVTTQSTTVLSNGGWAFNAGSGMIDANYPAGPTDIVQAGVPANAISFTITFSEPMNTATLNIPGVSWAAPAVTLTPNASRTVWTGTLPAGAPPAGSDPSGLYFLHITGTDLAGNALAGRSGFSSFDPAVALDPDSGATGTDTVHRFAIATQRDIVLVLDRSGSMASPAPGFASKMDALKDAGNIFLDILTPSTATDIAGVKYDNVVELLCPGCGMAPADAAQIDDLRTGINGLTARNMTSIGGGLVEAANQLSGAGNEKNLVLLFTDGKHNTPPSVASGLAAIHALVPDNTTISAIGFGTGSAINVPQLQTIVDSTNGQLWTTASGLELHKFFVEALMNAGGTPYSVFITDPVSSINRGQVQEHSFTINADDRQIAVIAEWGNTAGTLAMRLVSPNGVTITPALAGTNPRIRYSGGTSYAMYQLTFPLAASGSDPLAQAWQGTWRIVLDAAGMTAGTHDYAYSVVSSSDLALDARVVGGQFAGDKLYVVARLTRKGQPITGRLSALIDAPLVSTPNALAAFEVPASALARARESLQRKPVADTPLSAAGVYEYLVAPRTLEPVHFPRTQIRRPLLAQSKVPNIKLRPGEYLLEVPNTKVAGDYRITLTLNSVDAEQHSPRYVFLTRGLPPRVDSAATTIKVVHARDVRFLERKGTETLWVEVAPQDRFGNLLGAGLIDAKAFSAKVSGSKLESVDDEGDGRYTLRLQAPDRKRTITVRLNVAGTPVEFSVTPDGRLVRPKATRAR